MLNRNVVILLVTIPLATSSAGFLVYLSGILGNTLAPSPSLATTPIAAMVVGLALSAVIAANFMFRFGRKAGFILAQSMSLTATVMGMLAVYFKQFFLLLFCAFLLGSALSFIHQGRFAIVESLTDKKHTPTILSALLFCGVFAGFLGPEIAYRGVSIFPTEYLGSFSALACVHLVSLFGILLFTNPRVEARSENVEHGSYLQLLKDPKVVLAISCSAVGYGVMSLVMTATPNSMHDIYQHSLADTKWVIQSHIAAMYLPSICSGWILKRLGPSITASVGLLLFTGSISVGLMGVHLHHFLWSLILLGVAWNLLFLVGTSLIAQHSTTQSGHKLQGLNDMLTFGVQALAALSAGWILFNFGWSTLLLASLGLLLLLLISLIRTRL